MHCRSKRIRHRCTGIEACSSSPVKVGCLAAVKPAQEGGEPKPAALGSELLRSVFLIFWRQKNELSIDR
jgi:hypothetical protein